MKNNLKSKSSLYFINILDGDTSYKNYDKFLYLIDKNKYTTNYLYTDSYQKIWMT